jgi:hypothetical protein
MKEHSLDFGGPMDRTTGTIAALTVLVLLTPAVAGDALDVRFDWDEAELALAALRAESAAAGIDERTWAALAQTEGYRRLEQRERDMGRPFEADEFRSFLLDPEVRSRAPELGAAIEQWKRADLTRAAARALAYLPEGTTIRATIYPVIKPRSNSFVYQLDVDPAIFLYIDPAVTSAQFENTVAHELHHVGHSAACPEDPVADGLPDGARDALAWLGAFGEGYAMLAAAGGPEVHPHQTSDAEDRARWDRDLERFNDDLAAVEAFALDVALERETDPQQIRTRGFSFFGVQGPWYTVGWKMAVLIEQTHGRDALIETLCDSRRMLVLYNEAAAKRNADSGSGLRTWSPELLAILEPDP